MGIIKSLPISRQNEEFQTHDHEFLGSTQLAEEGEDRHNHRFAGVTTELIPIDATHHVHGFSTNTDFVDHHHEIAKQTEPNVDIGDGKHVHFVKGTTTMVDGHVHGFEFATLIQAPLIPS